MKAAPSGHNPVFAASQQSGTGQRCRIGYSPDHGDPISRLPNRPVYGIGGRLIRGK
jgi:hypothetical protein